MWSTLQVGGQALLPAQHATLLPSTHESAGREEGPVCQMPQINILDFLIVSLFMLAVILQIQRSIMAFQSPIISDIARLVGTFTGR